jgi:tRNA 2-thiocytidine biosynthesis protein TtcA
VQVKKMLAEWEREYPGRTETIFSAMRNVSPSHLADAGAFDFAGLDARRSSQGAETDAEPWEEA